jgi:hypothetical protein
MSQKKINFNGIQINSIIEKVFSFWSHKYEFIFRVLFFGVCVAGISFWYYSLYYFQWNDDQKQTYIRSQSQWTTLDTKNFEKSLLILENRKKIYQSDGVSVKNIFRTDSLEK